MGRKKNEDCRKHVTEVENGCKWICNYCNDKFSGGASRIEAHLGLNGKGGGIRRCSNYHEGVHNNMASTSSNPPPEAVIDRVYSTQDQVAEGVPEVIGTHTRSSVNHPNNVEIMNLSEGLNGSGGGNISVSESEINQLKQLVIDFKCEENDIAKQLQSLESRGKKRKPEVDVWLEELRDLKVSANEMNNLNDIHEINDLINNMKRHKEKKPLTLSTEFVGENLDDNIQKVLKLLVDDKVFVIGIYGMGGVGKTLLATLVENEVKRKASFKDVFWVTVSHNYSNSKLQNDIAKRIGLKLDEDDERIRADNLSLALEKKGKSILILDDVWKYFDLQKVGIHPKVNGIKVILTTRLKHVCHEMDCMPDHMIQMLPLYHEDLELFMLKLGHDGTPRTLPHEIEKIARCIVERFKGLPLAINVMARTMKGINDIHQWKHALNKLKKLEMGQEMEEKVFKVLKCSFDNLMEKNLQNCFLYCASLSIGVMGKDELILKLVDSGHINGNMCLEEIFDEGYTILNKLEAHSLISSNQYTHRLLRNMACYILKESQRNAIVKLNEKLTEIPFSHGWATDLELVHMRDCDLEEIPEGMFLDCPKLSILIINEVSICHIPDSFFKYMTILTILDLSYNESLESLPNSITKLRSLVSLVLTRCDSLTHVPPLGELQALSRLVISGTSIKEAPQGLERLINLKWLDLSSNRSLNMDLRSFSSNLTKLQYLDLQCSNALTKAEDIERMKMLECFGGGFDFKEYNHYMQNNLDTMFGLKTYYFRIPNNEYVFWGERFVPSDPETKTIQFGECDHFSHILPEDLTCLYIAGNSHWVCLCDGLSYNTDSSSLRKIGTDSCQQLESLFCLSGSCSFCTNILNLEVLKLIRLKSLTIVCKEVFDVRQSLSPGGIFSCLKEFSILRCHLIEKLFTPQLVQQLQNLETISVSFCDSMKEIFAVSNSDDNDRSIISLPKLTELTLEYLPELKIVCKGSISCGSSPKVVIDDCPNKERDDDPTIIIRNPRC